VACLGLVGDSGASYLIDATPDFTAQTAMLPAFPSAIFLTHAHIGHYTGLMYLGREGMNASGVQVHATPALSAFLRANEPWASLPVSWVTHEPGTRVFLEEGLSLESIPVPHRNEHADTVAYLVIGPERRLLYLPDIDRWDIDLSELLARCDLALLDGSFYSRDELPRQTDVPHPPIEETLDRLKPDEAAKVRFFHLNHTNPLLDAEGPSALIAREGEEIPL
jgi:pyrroloquinoline quinone biosynthesis protein B